MATEIFNDGACIRILSNNNTLLISKLQIKTIDTVRTDTVRVDLGEGALKNIYIKVSEVVTPQVFVTADDLRDFINGMLLSNTSGSATEINQQEEIHQLQLILAVLLDIKTLINNYKGGKGTPQQTDESNPGVVYNGYAAAGSDPSSAVWAIQRVTRTKDLVVYAWADGNENYDNVWDGRLSLTYLPA
jgi:hypothetical protein